MGFNKKVLILFILIGIFAFLKVFALEINWPTSPMGTDLVPGSTITDLVKYLYEWGIAIGGIATFIALLIGGFLYLTSAGDPARLREAKDRIFSAITGLALLLGSWLILNTINPELTVLRPPSFRPPEVSSEFNPMALIEAQKSCHHVILYKDPYWTPATPSQVVMADYNPGLVTTTTTIPHPRSIRFFQELAPPKITTTTDSTTTVVETCVDNRVNLTVITEMVVTEPDGTTTTITTTTPPSATRIYCESYMGVDYKEGGSCTVEFYGPPGWWGLFGPCGDKIGNTNTSVHNIKISLGTEENVHCVKVTKTGFD